MADMTLPADKINAAIEAIKGGDGDAALTLLQQLLVAAMGGDADAGSDSADAATEGGDAPPKPIDGSAPVATGKLSAAFVKATGHKTEAEFLAHYKTMQEDVAALSATQSAIALNSRRALIAELIKLDIETPAFAWLGKTDEERAKRQPCARLMAEPLDEMSSRVATLKKLRPATPEPPTGGGPDSDDDVSTQVAKLSAKTLAAIKKKGLTPEEYVVATRTVVRRIG
jgi:hypothetical protein